jgi:uncharacterized membrane protein
MTVDEALKYIISMGVVAPRAQPGPPRGEAAEPSGYPAPATRAPSEIRN